MENCGETGAKAAPFHKEPRRIGFPPNLDEGDLQRGQRINAKAAPFPWRGYMIRGQEQQSRGRSCAKAVPFCKKRFGGLLQIAQDTTQNDGSGEAVTQASRMPPAPTPQPLMAVAMGVWRGRGGRGGGEERIGDGVGDETKLWCCAGVLGF